MYITYKNQFFSTNVQNSLEMHDNNNNYEGKIERDFIS